jgi:tRNA/rRNA methyltransferase
MSSQSSIQRNISIILVEPQMGENIGATARAMKNFALSDLRLISPRDGWPNEKAKSMSVGALDLIENAKTFESIPEAIKDLEYVYAATAAPRDMNKDYVLSRDLNSYISQNQKIGIMFGRENSGLNNQEISYANKILTIDTDVNFSSLNIAHSVAVICYELFQGKKQVRNDLDNVQDTATNQELGDFYDHLFETLDKKSFFKTLEKKEHMSLKIRNLFGRVDNLSKQEIQTLRGIITSLSKGDI